MSDPTLDKIVAVLVENVLNPFIKLLFVAATAVFIWGIIQFLTNVEDAEQKEAGKRHMIWGIIGLTIMLGVWGIINLVSSLWA